MENPLHKERNDAIVQAVIDGQSMAEAGRAHDLTRQRVSQLIRRRNARGLVPTKAQRDEAIAQAAAQGRTRRQIAQDFGLGYSTVVNILTTIGANPPKETGLKPDHPARNEAIAREALDGARPDQLAAKHGLSYSGIVAILNRRGIHLRRKRNQDYGAAARPVQTIGARQRRNFRRDQTILAALARGESQAELARTHDVSTARISQIARQARKPRND